jgi:hypothetical protein
MAGEALGVIRVRLVSLSLHSIGTFLVRGGSSSEVQVGPQYIEDIRFRDAPRSRILALVLASLACGVRLSFSVVNREIRQFLYDEIAALPATLLHLEQLPLLLENKFISPASCLLSKTYGTVSVDIMSGISNLVRRSL